MKEREHSHSEIAKADRAEWLIHAEKLQDTDVVINKKLNALKNTERKNI